MAWGWLTEVRYNSFNMRPQFYFLCFFTLALFAYPIPAQSTPRDSLRFASIVAKDAEYLEITRERIFEGTALYGFMNGGSELFLEYGFQQLLEQRLTYQGVQFIVEYYLMDSPQHAYGIYSVHTFKCRRADKRFPIECLTPGLLQLYHGHLYISLKCMDRNIDAQPLLDSLAEMITGKNPVTERDKSIDFTAFPIPYSGALYYVCGDLGLSAAYITWASFFTPYPHFAMWLRIDPESKEVNASVCFDSTSEAESFCAKNEKRFLLKRNNNVVNIRQE